LSKKRSPQRDPFAAREAEKYENPIPSREFILDLLDTADQPITHVQMCEMLKLSDEDQVEALRRRLIAMARDGQLISNRRDAYVRLDKIAVVRGRVQGHRDGFGFVIRPDGEDDIYLHNRQMRKVFDGDEVLVRLSGEQYRGKEEGAIVEVLQRNTQQLAGRFFNEDGLQFVRPENARITQDIMIPFGSYGGAAHGQIVVAEITQQPDKNRPPMGRVLQVLGDHMAPGMEIELAIQAHSIPYEWPEDVSIEASKIAPEVLAKDKLHRVDVRHLPFVTIDGEDARDFDDAVLCERRKGGWRLYVAIADVSHYVQVESALDIEARARGNSVYFPDYVVPMLPEALSNGLCSLNPHLDRLCMVCEMNISDAGRITGYQFYEGVMYSHARLTYTKVGEILTGSGTESEALRAEYSAVVPQLELLHKLYKCLRIARDERGAIDFETVETRIQFNDERKIERIVPVKRNDAHKLIEECMLCANVSAAKFLEKHNLVGLYRVHEGPTDQKLTNLRALLSELGLGLAGGDKPSSGDYQQLMQSIQGRADSNMIQTVMLRSLRQAMYQVENHGHFGLGYEAYTHFTSPIRRYPDLMVHRAIRSVIRSETPSTHVRRVDTAKPIPLRKIYPYSVNDVVTIGEQCSRTERRADEATRDVVSWLKCEYLRDQVGAIFDGHISSVTGFGLFVELNDLYVEGLIHITALPHDYYRFEPAQHRLVGERTRKVFGLGDELVVRVVRVDLDNRKIDFELEGVGAVRKPKSSVKPKAAARGKGGRKTGGKNAPKHANAPMTKRVPLLPPLADAAAKVVETVKAKKVVGTAIKAPAPKATLPKSQAASSKAKAVASKSIVSKTAAPTASAAKVTAVKSAAVSKAADVKKPAAKKVQAVKAAGKVASPKVITAASKKPAATLSSAEKKLAAAKAAVDKAVRTQASASPKAAAVKAVPKAAVKATDKAGAKPTAKVAVPAPKLSRAARKAANETTQKKQVKTKASAQPKAKVKATAAVAGDKNAPKSKKDAGKTASAAVQPTAAKSTKKSPVTPAPKVTAKRKVVKPTQSN